jgi:non-ribosomal peptide synthase protein (TIGR01720 family)
LSLERDVSVRLEEPDFTLLRRRMPAEYGLTVNQTLLAALLVGYTEWSGQSSVHVDLVGRGRELGGDDLDLTRAIGRFPVTSPRLLERGAADDPPSLLRDVARQLAEVPRAGLGFGLLRYFDVHPEVAEALAPLDRPDIILINWGEAQPRESASPLFGDAVEVQWPMPAVQRTHRLKAFARTDDGALVFTLSYSEKLNDRERIEHLAELVGAALRSFVREDDGRPGSEQGEDARI